MTSNFGNPPKVNYSSTANLSTAAYNTASSDFYKPYSGLNTTSEGHKIFRNTVRDSPLLGITINGSETLNACQNNQIKGTKDPSCLGMSNI